MEPAEFGLVTVSKMGEDVLKENVLKISNADNPNMKELHWLICNVYPSLAQDKYDLYWRYSHSSFFPVKDFLSLFNAILMSAEKKLYLVVQDTSTLSSADEEMITSKDVEVLTKLAESLPALAAYTVDEELKNQFLGMLKKGFPTSKKETVPSNATIEPRLTKKPSKEDKKNAKKKKSDSKTTAAKAKSPKKKISKKTSKKNKR